MENSISRQNVNVNVRAVVTDPNVTVQYKTKVLQKNVVSGVNTLTPAMISEANTKYIIKYDYTLSDNITIPANCVLEFDGGSISGEHYLIGTKTKVKGYSNSGSAIWGGEFVDYYTNKHISNYYKKTQSKDFRMSVALCGFSDNVNPNDMMKFHQRMGNDYYHVCYNLDVVIENGIPTSLIWKTKATNYDTTVGVTNLANRLCHIIDNTKLGIFDGIKLHTENDAIDSLLTSGNVTAISAFIDLYTQDIISFLTILGSERRSKIKRFFIFNEEPSLIELICATETLKTKVNNLVADIKERCPNTCILIPCSGKEVFQEGYFDIVDYHSQNFYLGNISYLGNDVKDDTGFSIAVKSNKYVLDRAINNTYTFGISETGCTNKEISLVRGGYWRQDTTNSFSKPFEGYYYYCKVLLELLNLYIGRIQFLQLWFIDAFYMDSNNNIRDFYGNNYSNVEYFNKVFNLINSYLYE